ncbi:MAG TPA: tRNA (guanosine(46)-N7)-methyltransferase TrmB [Verrucomicrobiae bacterium]|jgi:tRNA (guanine-N7-)-methyltransferase
MNEVSSSSTTPEQSLIYQPSSIIDRLALNSLFPKPQPLEVELGSGDGSFIVQWAALHPERNFLAVERLLGRLRKIDKKGRRAGLQNLRAVRLEAWYLVEYLLPPGCVSALHIYFPDPWPKRKHRKNRLINAAFAEAAARALASEGVVYLRTDDPDYFKQMLEVFAAHQNFRPTQTQADLQGVITDFEREFKKRGVATLSAAYARI